jgi:hypothetical protein
VKIREKERKKRIQKVQEEGVEHSSRQQIRIEKIWHTPNSSPVIVPSSASTLVVSEFASTQTRPPIIFPPFALNFYIHALLI